MNKPDFDLIDASAMSEEDIIKLIQKDYLQFCLRYTLAGRKLSFNISDKIEFKILDDGVIACKPISSSLAPTEYKRIILSCGIHGNETAPIEICNLLLGDLFKGNLSLSHEVLFLFGNIPAMLIAKRFVNENLNRLFSHKIDSDTLEGKRAKRLMGYVDEFFKHASGPRYHYDLHTAIRPSINEKFAVYPYLHGQAYNTEQLSFLSHCDVNTILLSQSPTGTFSYFSSYHYQADAFTVELGKVKPFAQNDMNDFSAVIDALKMLLSQKSIRLRNYKECPLEIYTVNQVINKHQHDFRLHFSDEIANFTSFRKGQTLASEKDKIYYAEYDGEAIVFPNADVALGQRALLTVIPYDL